MQEHVGLIKALFDISFTEFITTKIVKVLYIISIFGAGVVGLAMIVGGIKESTGAAVLSIILAPIVFILLVAVARIWMEILIVVFRIAENTRDMARQVRSETAETKIPHAA